VFKNADYNKFNLDRCSVKDKTFLKQQKKVISHTYEHKHRKLLTIAKAMYGEISMHKNNGRNLYKRVSFGGFVLNI
jgi:hypothetical protein